MGSFLLTIFILTIWHSILLYSKSLGLNVILFIVPLLIFLIIVLKKKDLIKNKKGLLFAIPIVLLSATYFIYDHTFLRALNALVIPTLIILMYIFTVRPTNRFTRAFTDAIYLVFEPLGCIGKVFNLLGMKLGKIFKLSKDGKKKLVSILIVTPITIVVLYLLSKGDMMFAKLMDHVITVLKNIKFAELLGRFIIISILFIYLASVVNYLLFNYDNKNSSVSQKRKYEPFTMNLLLTVLNIIYLVFAAIQVVSLVFHKVASSIDYAKYARSGFFWLIVISIINLTILILTKRVKNEETNKYIKVMGTIMTLLTLVVIASAFVRMYMYCDYFGYTTLRLTVYSGLITLAILLIPTLIYLFNSKSNVFKHYLSIIVVSYTIMNLIPLNNIIANHNIERYNETGKIDQYYLQNYSADNVEYLTKLYDNIKPENHSANKEIDIYDLNWYLFNGVDVDTKGFQEFNISKQKAKKVLKQFKETHKELDYLEYYKYDEALDE